VSAWGYNVYGQLGNGTTTSSASPVTVTGLSGVTDIAAGNYHALAVRSDGTVAAWGLNNAGQLGDGTTVNRSTPVTVKGLSGVVQVAAGGLPGYAGQSVALKSDGTVWTWGYGKSGQLGLGVAGSTPTPTKVAGLPSIVQVAASGDNTYALAGDGTLWAWGDDSYGQIGNTAAAHTQTTPMKVSISAVTSVGAGGTHALALTSDGTAWAWGNDNTGQLGDGGACGKTCSHPVKVSGLTGAAALTGGYVHSLAVLTDGTMRSWGRNAEGELGDGTTTVRSTPVPVAGLTGITPSSLVRDSYAYDGDGLRASRTSGSVTQHFAWGRFGGTPLLLTDGSTSYVYDDGGQPVEQIDASGTPLYYQHDAYGSTRMLTDANGAVAATFSYDPYGRLTSHTGSADTPLRWNAQYQDVDTGLYYLRARYYDPLTAQFLTRDPAEMLTHSPYAYASGNPLAYSDPSGLCNANPFSGSFWTDGNCISDAAGAVWSGVTDLWNGIVSHASEISAASATLAVVLAPVPGVAEVLGAVAVVTGAIATADDVSHGEYLQAALDALGTLIGGAGLYNDVRAAMAMRAAQEAWDAGEAVLTLAKSAASAEEIGAMLDKVSAAIADLSLLVPKPCE
jgi:RHS repeat-associated protein